MSAPEGVLVFGAGATADVVLDTLRETGLYDPVALAVDSGFMPGVPHASGLPVLEAEAAMRQFPPDVAKAFVAIGYHACNNVRAERIDRLRAAGYALATICSPHAHVAESAELGRNTFVMAGASLQSGARIGDGTFIFSGATVGHHATLGECCWIASGAAVGGAAYLGPKCFVGLNATIVNEVALGQRCFVGAATLVARDAPDERVFISAASEALRVDTSHFLDFSRLR